MDKRPQSAWRWLTRLGAAALLQSARSISPRLKRHHAPEPDRLLPRQRRDGQHPGRRASDYAPSHEQLRELSAALQTIREEERIHISRELHDDLGQRLATLRLDLSLLQQHPATPEAERQMQSIDELLLAAISSLRRIASNLRPRALDEGGLFRALQSLHGEFAQRHAIACELDAIEAELALEDRYSTAVFRILQESLTNIARYAQAGHVWLSVRKRDAHLRIGIEDDGKGISQADLNKAHAFGLLGMRERVRALQGQIEIGGRPAGGTRIVIQLPLRR
jgi:signal transduction histidine kinase